MRKELASLALVLGLTGPLAFADPGSERPGPHGSPPHEVLLDSLDELGVSAEQSATIEDLVATYQPDMDAIEAQLDALRPADGKRESLSEADRDEVRALHEEMHSLGRELMEGVQAELSDAQWEAAKELLPRPPRRGPPGSEAHGRGGPGGDEDCRPDSD